MVVSVLPWGVPQGRRRRMAEPHQDDFGRQCKASPFLWPRKAQRQTDPLKTNSVWLLVSNWNNILDVFSSVSHTNSDLVGSVWVREGEVDGVFLPPGVIQAAVRVFPSLQHELNRLLVSGGCGHVRDFRQFPINPETAESCYGNTSDEVRQNPQYNVDKEN